MTRPPITSTVPAAAITPKACAHPPPPPHVQINPSIILSRQFEPAILPPDRRDSTHGACVLAAVVARRREGGGDSDLMK